jgi:hypothetical protein
MKKEQQIIKQFPFKIGEQYELNEFKVEAYVIVKGIKNGYEYLCYKLLDTSHMFFFELNPKRGVLLAYNADFLSQVYYYFYEDCFDYLVSKIDYITSTPMKVSLKTRYGLRKRARVVLSNDYVLEVILKSDGNTCVRLTNLIHEDDLE